MGEGSISGFLHVQPTCAQCRASSVLVWSSFNVCDQSMLELHATDGYRWSVNLSLQSAAGSSIQTHNIVKERNRHTHTHTYQRPAHNLQTDTHILQYLPLPMLLLFFSSVFGGLNLWVCVDSRLGDTAGVPLCHT